jgi:hypothetical protein
VTDEQKARELFRDVRAMVSVTSGDEARANAARWLEEIARLGAGSLVV